MAAGETTQGRRIPVPESGDINDVLWDFLPGDYCGPIEGYTGEKPAVFFLPPVARDESVAPTGREIAHVTSPPHSFAEQLDGSLEIRASILLDYGSGATWHGYLDAGNVWREV